MNQPTLLVLGSGRKLSPSDYGIKDALGQPVSDLGMKFLTLDADPYVGATMTCTLGFEPIPLPDNSVDAAVALHVLEHIGRQGETGAWFFFWEDLYRVLKPAGTLQFECPYATSVWAWADPTHTRAITEYSFLYFNQDSYRIPGSAIPTYRVKADFAFVPKPNGAPSYDLIPDHTNESVRQIEKVSFIRGRLAARKPFRSWWEHPEMGA